MASDANAPNPQPAAEHVPADWRFGFWSLIATQFQGAFNDNTLKFLVIYLIVAMNFPPARRDSFVTVVGALFALPFIFFSMAGGYLADRYSKRVVTIGTKYFEIGVMLFATTALALRNLPMECAGVFLISTQGALFGPSKYGLLPELLPERKLSWGNGILELGTFLAAISGTVAAGYLAFHFRGRQFLSGLVLLGFTMIGLTTSFGISRVPAANPNVKFRPNPLGDLWQQIQIMRRDRILAWAVIGNTYLFYLAALLQFVVVIYGHDVLRVNETQTSYLTAAVGIGIGFGSLAAGYLSGGKIEYGLVPLGALGMTVFSLLVSRAGLTVWHVRAELALLGFFGGFYAVPLGALIQFRPRPETKGGVIAAANLLSFVGIFAAAGAYDALAAGLHLGPRQIFMAGGAMTFLAGLYAVFALPDSLLRLGLWIATHTIYRVRIEGRDNLPDRGGIIFYAPALSRFQQLMLLSALDRQVHFVTPPDPPPDWNQANDALCICRPAQPSRNPKPYTFVAVGKLSYLNVDVVLPRGSRIFSRIAVQFSLRKSPPSAAGDSAVAEGIT
jgi:acyl-[acyl-carrier-protein]-phospholipid O-acyltransferase/long-chain-fatty-acid--[acyl-carrier-protein] ligase